MPETLAAQSDAIPEGEVIACTVDGRAIAIARSDSKVYAFDDMCSHERSALSKGFVEGSDIECERHGARFDMATGAVTLPPATEPIVVYTAVERDGQVFVELTDAARAE
jgi:nitrite reductase/ring-hydroxylating ferredoxin subunit